MLLKSLALPIILFSAGLGNFNFINNQTNDIALSSTSRLIHGYSKKFSTDKLQSMEIDSFTLQARVFGVDGRVTIHYDRSVDQSYRFHFKAYDEEWNKLFDVEEYLPRYESGGGSFTLYLPVRDIHGLITFEFSYYMPFLNGQWIFAEFELLFGSKKLVAPYYEAWLPYEADICPNERYCVSYGDFVKIKNLKPLYEIPYFGKFSFNDLGLLFYMEARGGPMYVRGEPYIRFNISSKLAGLDLKENVASSIEAYLSGILRLELLDTSSSDTKELKNVKNYYYEENNYYFSKSAKNGYESTKDFYFPKVLYEQLKEIVVTVGFPAFTKTDGSIYFDFTIKFLKPSQETSFEIVGEIDDGIEKDEDLIEVAP